MLIKVCLLLLSVGVYASYADGISASTEDPLFSELDFIFPGNFVSRFPQESEFFTVKIFVYLFFNLFAKYLGENEPSKFWSKFNHNDFNRVAIDAAFYEYLTKFADGKRKHLIYNPLASSGSSPEDIAIHRIGDYLDNLSATEVPTEESETLSQATETEGHQHHDTKCAISVETPISGIPGKDFPNYCDVPKTSFTCADKLVPGIYADVETGCQAFHTCWPRRIDSFLCPIGTTFNQALLTCDFWHESDCSSSPQLFDHSPFAKRDTPINTESTTTMGETSTTSEHTTSTPESEIPEYDGTCQSIFSEPLLHHMKILPAKCKVTDLKPSTPEPTSKYDGKPLDQLMAEMLKFIIKAAELGSKMQEAGQWPELKMEWSTPKLDSKTVKVAVESSIKNEGVDTSEEQIYTSTSELPSDNQEKSPPRMNSRYLEESVMKKYSHGRVTHLRSVRKSTLLKPSKPSEHTIKQVFDTIAMSLDLGGKILNDGLLPLVEKIVLDSHRKKSKSS